MQKVKYYSACCLHMKEGLNVRNCYLDVANIIKISEPAMRLNINYGVFNTVVIISIARDYQLFTTHHTILVHRSS